MLARRHGRFSEMTRPTIPTLAGAVMLVAAPAFAQTPTMNDGERLAGASIAEAFAGATLSGVNAFGNPYRVVLDAAGTMSGVAGPNDEYADTGRWWVEGDLFCRQWQVWLDGVADCFVAVREAGFVHWFCDDGSFVATESYDR
jgi:GntR family transcriptional regulator/MocR family aminotransferase